MNKANFLNVIERINDKCLEHAMNDLNVDYPETDEEQGHFDETCEVGDLQVEYFQDDITEFMLRNDVPVELFEDEEVMAIEKLHGTCVSIVIQEGTVTEVYNRTERVPFINKGKSWIIKGIC